MFIGISMAVVQPGYAGEGAAPPDPEFTPVAGVSNWLKANNAKLLAALTATKANTADTLVAYMGDSTAFGQNSAGTGTTNAKVYSAPAQLAALLDAASIPASRDSWWGGGEAGVPSVSFAALMSADPKLSTTGTGINENFACIGGACITSSDTTSTFTYTTEKSCNRVDVYFLEFSAGGDFRVTVDGGAEGAANSTIGAVRKMGKLTINLGASAVHAVKFRLSSANCFLIGFRFYDTNTRRVIIENQGACGWKTSNWTDTTNGESPGNNFALTGAHLAILQAGLVNDRGLFADPTAPMANIQTMVNGYVANNTTPWLMNPEPVSDSPAVALAYQSALLAKANANNLTYLDYMNTYTNVTDWFAAGLGDGVDNIHPNAAGYGYIAARQATLLQAAWAAA